MDRNEVEKYIVRELDDELLKVYWTNLKFIVSVDDTKSESFQVAVEIDQVFRKFARRFDKLTQSQGE